MKYVDRTCSEVRPDGRATPDELPAPHRLSRYADRSAWVLLGPPGAGKTVEFKREAARFGGCYVTARNFLTLNEPDWRTSTLFIDALDEMRAGPPDGRTPLDRIRTKLDELGRPPFRLSCREADWFGASDRGHLAAVSPDGDILELHLEPLSNEQVRDLLERRGTDPGAVFQAAGKAGLSALLATPQDLELLAKVVASGGWPETRLTMFESACRQLAREQNEEHLIAAEGKPFATEQLLDAAGDLCAVALLSGHAGYVVASTAGDEHYIPLNAMPGSPPLLRAALRTRLFAYATPQHATPTHRQVAEFLAARRLAQAIRDGLPPARVMALMTGPDGGVVSSLRGLCAWLAAHSAKVRPDCIARDPVGTLLYGNVKGFTAEQKRELVEALMRVAVHDPWILTDRLDLDFRWGDLATPDITPIFRKVLARPVEDDVAQGITRVLLLALRHGPPIPAMKGFLIEMVRDSRVWSPLRTLALAAFIRQHGDEDSALPCLLQLLRDIEDGAVSDPHRHLLGALLTHLYPKVVRPAEILCHLREPDNPMVTSGYDHFWATTAVQKATDTELAAALDVLVQQRSSMIIDGYLHGPFASRILARLLQGPMDIAAERLFSWLDVLAKQEDSEVWDSLSNWLRKNPGRAKAMQAAAAGHPRRASILRDLEAPSVEHSPSDEVRRWQEQWQSFVCANRVQIEDNCPPGVLNELAEVYWGSMILVEGNTPTERLHFLLQDDGLVQLAIGAIRDTPKRADLPTFAEVAALQPSAPHPLKLPYLAALDGLPASAVAKQGKDGQRLALAFRIEPPTPSAAWYDDLLEADPRLVASTLVDYCRTAFRCGNVPHWFLARLALDADHARVAEAAALDLLKLFPPRCRAEHLPTLRCLLLAALERASRRKLSALVKHKLSLRGLTAMQRLHWLCCGLTLEDTHLEPLLSLLAGRYQHQRIQCVVVLMRERVLRVDALEASGALPLVELLAELSPPASLSDGNRRGPIPESVADAADAADAVRRLLDHLASLATGNATDALGQLAANARLSRWQPEVQNALTNQLATRREAEFRHASVDDVLATLGGAAPANSADLMALVADCLRSLASRVAAGDTSDWRQYWNTDGKRVTAPKHEELCRDAVLSDLRNELPPGVNATSEAVHAADRRSDIRVSFRDFAVPIEVKRSCHRDLWKAMRTQLIGNYAKDPAAQGHGIYLVFWFGRERCQLPSDGSSRPRTAAELETRLRETLTPEECRKIEVVVFDVAGPAQIP